MSIIPSTFNEHQIQQTVLGGTEPIPNIKLPVAVILLNTGTGGLYRTKLIERLIKNGFSSIVSIDKTAENYNVEDFARMFPCVRFVVPHENVSIGDMINIGMAELEEDYVLVINDSIHVGSSMLSGNVLDRYIAEENLCVVPRLVDAQRQPLPVRFTPMVESNTLKPISSSLISERIPTLYPFDFVGIYNRQRFVKLGGYDYTITSPYWQNLDFSVRSWLWGESIVMSPLFQLAYDDSVPVEDSTPDKSQLRFYLKNCAPKFSADRCYIPISRFFSYKKQSGRSFADARRDFKVARNWVEKNRYNFTKDIYMLIDSWGKNQG